MMPPYLMLMDCRREGKLGLELVLLVLAAGWAVGDLELGSCSQHHHCNLHNLLQQHCHQSTLWCWIHS